MKADHDELRRLAEAAFEPRPSPDTVVRETRISAAQPGPVVVMDARDILALLDERDALKKYEKMAFRLTDAMTRWGWSHCTAEVELIESVDALIAQRDALEQLASKGRMMAGTSKPPEVHWRRATRDELAVELAKQIAINDALERRVAELEEHGP